MNIKEKIKILFIIIFIVFLIIPIFLYLIGYKNETFIGDNVGNWKLILRQTYSSPSKIIKGESVNEDTLGDTDYYNKEIKVTDYTIKYKLNDNTNVDIQYYKLLGYDNEENLQLNIEWRQNDIKNVEIVDYSSTTDLNFSGLIIDNSDSIYLGKYNSIEGNQDLSFNLGEFNTSDGSLNILGNSYNRVELYVWNPRPENIIEKKNSIVKINPKNTLDFENLSPIRVNMSNVDYYSRKDNTIKTAGENSYSYCFGKVLCSDPSYNIKYNNNIIQPYCDENKNIPVYCSGSGLYSTDETTKEIQYNDMKSNSKSINFEIIGEYLSPETIFDGNLIANNQKNAFRGLTAPFVETNDKTIKYNEPKKIVRIKDNSGGYIDQHICEFLDNKIRGFDLNPSTTIKDECYNINQIEDFKDGHDYKDTEKKCIANYGEPLHDTKYIDYVCPENEVCFDYVCGKKFGTCKKINI
jgi:hypothetical protein